MNRITPFIPMRKFAFLLALAVGATTLHGAQTFETAAEQARVNLNAALDELDALQYEIGGQRPELGARLDEVEDDALRLRDQASNAARIQQGFDVEVSQLNNERQSVIDNNRYIQSTLLNEYIRRLELTIDPSEIPQYRGPIRDALSYLEGDEQFDDETIFRAQLKVIGISLDRIASLIGGKQYEGSAIVNGVFLDGTFTNLGPVSYFASEDGTAAGITQGMIDNRANIYTLTGQYASHIIQVTESGSGILPIDTTGGEALETIRQDITLLEEWAQGGVVMYPILGLFSLAILITIFKAIELMRVRAARGADLDIILEHLSDNNKEGAVQHAKAVGGPVGEMLVAAVENSDEDKEVIEEILYEKIVKAQPRLERFLAFIAVVAATAPLLGLLGTVTGMIKTFKLITIVGTGDARNLSSGISEALITTKWGLIVAIPTLIFHALLNRKAKGVIGSMEQAAVSFINGVGELRSNADKKN